MKKWLAGERYEDNLFIDYFIFGCSSIMVEEVEETGESIIVVDPFIVNVDSGERYKVKD